jgi:hypothetical protein
MNGKSTLSSSATAPSPSRLIYVVRMMLGGAVAGFFLGSLIGCLGGFLAVLATESWEPSVGGIFAMGLVFSTLGAAWGLVLGLIDAMSGAIGSKAGE